MTPSLDELIKRGEGAQEAVDVGDGIFMSRNIANSYLVTSSDGDLLINTGTDFEAEEINAGSRGSATGRCGPSHSRRVTPTTSAGGVCSTGQGSDDRPGQSP